MRRLEPVWTTVSGLNLYARVSRAPADAPAVVLVHGVGVSGRYLLPTAERLAAHCRTYIPDLPGFGKSSKPDHILTIPELADALAAWVEQAGPRRAAYLGNSLGCQTIVDFALRYPHLIDRAILVGPTMDPHGGGLAGAVARGCLDMFHEPIYYWPILAFDYLRAGPIRTLQTLRYGVRDPFCAKLPRVRIPVLVVRGEHDPIAPQRWVEQMGRLLPDARLVVLPGSAHAANYSVPDDLARVTLGFLQEQHTDLPAPEPAVS